MQLPERRYQSQEHRGRVVAALNPELELLGIAPKVLLADADVRSVDAVFR